MSADEVDALVGLLDDSDEDIYVDSAFLDFVEESGKCVELVALLRPHAVAGALIEWDEGTSTGNGASM